LRTADGRKITIAPVRRTQFALSMHACVPGCRVHDDRDHVVTFHSQHIESNANQATPPPTQRLGFRWRAVFWIRCIGRCPHRSNQDRSGSIHDVTGFLATNPRRLALPRVATERMAEFVCNDKIRMSSGRSSSVSVVIDEGSRIRYGFRGT